MADLKPPGRGSDPLHVLAMALALVAAAFAGAMLGFAIDYVSGGSQHSESD